MKAILSSFVVVQLAACMHASPHYPGAGGENIDPNAYVNASCPDLSGTFDGVGEVLDGDDISTQYQPHWRIDFVFPYGSTTDMAPIQLASQRSDGAWERPRYGNVAVKEERVYDISLAYPNGKTATQESSIFDKGRFVCTGIAGKIIWGGALPDSRSEFGPNKIDSYQSVYLDEAGSLIYERGMQVHMSMFFGLVPTGTSQSFARYRFKRLR